MRKLFALLALLPALALGGGASSLMLSYGATESVDPFYSSVVSLMHFSGAEGSTTFVDEKGNTWTATGTAQQTQTLFQFAPGSLVPNVPPTGGGGGDYIETPSSASFGYGTGDFTIEMWIKQTSGDANAFNIFYDQRTALNQAVPTLYYPTDGSLRYFVSGADQITSAAGTIVTTGTTPWQFIAISRVSGNTRLFVDGVQVGSTFVDATNYVSSHLLLLQAGDNLIANIGLNGAIDDFRITNGVGRYTGNFTPPTAPFPNQYRGSLWQSTFTNDAPTDASPDADLERRNPDA